jgi:hypothetical protein
MIAGVVLWLFYSGGGFLVLGPVFDLIRRKR